MGGWSSEGQVVRVPEVLAQLSHAASLAVGLEDLGHCGRQYVVQEQARGVQGQFGGVPGPAVALPVPGAGGLGNDECLLRRE